jgi:hypothetical protein
MPTLGKEAVSSDISECPRNSGVWRGKPWEAVCVKYTEAHLSLLLTPLQENAVVNIKNESPSVTVHIVVSPTGPRTSSSHKAATSAAVASTRGRGKPSRKHGRCLWGRFAVHYTPNSIEAGSTKAEIEVGLFSRKCLGKRRIEDIATPRRQGEARNRRINRDQVTIKWKFPRKLARLN